MWTRVSQPLPQPQLQPHQSLQLDHPYSHDLLRQKQPPGGDEEGELKLLEEAAFPGELVATKEDAPLLHVVIIHFFVIRRAERIFQLSAAAAAAAAAWIPVPHMYRFIQEKQKPCKGMEFFSKYE
ncbi:hypothetical protein ACLOJK_022238 [Asimina triloba]